jgi:hypothetical protein
VPLLEQRRRHVPVERRLDLGQILSNYYYYFYYYY